MRYFDFTLTPKDGQFHPVDGAIAEHPAATRESLLHINQLGDGTGVLLYRLRGDPTPLVDRIRGHPDLVTHDLLDVQDGLFHLYVHVMPGEPGGSLLELAHEHALIIDTPIEFTPQGGLSTTVVGTHEMLRQAVEELPDGVRFSIEQVGEYSPDSHDILSVLTERQLEVFRTAVELGYYEIPRRATHQDIADHLDCAPSTVDEHLRKAESRVLSTLV
jgi:DNA-binding NarL/FixJ family response regulator